MKPEHVKLIDALLVKAVQAGWVPVEQATDVMSAIKRPASKPRKKVKSPELGT